MGGASTSIAIDAMIPDYYKHVAQGLNVAIWGKGTLRGRGAEAVGRGVARATSTVVRIGPKALIKAGTRFVPFVGWAMAAHEVAGFYPGGAWQFYHDAYAGYSDPSHQTDGMGLHPWIPIR